MCGIVGYVGNKMASQVLINGLKKLEYRGYDSARVSFVSGGSLSAVSADGKIAVVHNGIIENYASLKAKLQQDGVEFKSDTDTEVVAHRGSYEILNLQRQAVQRDINRIIITACGTSFYAGMVGEYMIEELAGVPVEVEYASEFRYRNPIIKPGTLILAISQSGETADTLAAMKEAHQKGATVLAICNAVGSSIARNSDGGVYLHAGPEIGVASTKAFSGQVMVLAMIALLLGRQRCVSFEHGMEIAHAITNLPELVEETLALEGALKLKEISYIHAEGYPAAEMKHGPIALIDENMPVVVIAPKDALFDKIISNIREIKARGGKVVAVTTQDCSPLDEFADDLIKVPTTLPMLMPILTCVPLQLLAYHIATLRGNNVDQPRNLAKSVTVE
jgi:glucosamine--fructose-6-phosphate aminotransferase (isomerizing)